MTGTAREWWVGGWCPNCHRPFPEGTLPCPHDGATPLAMDLAADLRDEKDVGAATVSRNPADIGILATAQHIVMDARGSYDMPEAERIAGAAYLRQKLDTWEPSESFPEYDAAVRALVEAALATYVDWSALR